MVMWFVIRGGQPDGADVRELSQWGVLLGLLVDEAVFSCVSPLP